MTRLDGSTFRAPVRPGRRGLQPARPVEPHGHRAVPAPARRPARPARRRRRLVPVRARPGAEGRLLPIESALTDSKPTRHLADEIVRLERLLPVLHRPGGLRRGQVYLSQDEAWELMTVTGPTLEAAGFEVRVPALSRRKPTPALRLFVEPAGDVGVGAHQLSNVRWSAVFDDVELTAADVARLAAEARPLVRSRGKWVELDRVDLKEAAAALAERAGTTTMTGAEILRHGRRPRGHRRSAGLTVEGSGWATDLLEKARRRPTPVTTSPRASSASCAPTRPRRSPGSASSTPSSSAAASPSTWASARRPPSSPTSPAPRATGPPSSSRRPPSSATGPPRRRASRPSCASSSTTAPSRASADELEAEVAGADVVITTYGTAVRDVDALAERHVGPHRPRRGAGHQEPGQRDGPAAAPHPRPHPPRPHRHADRERPRRPLVDPRLHQPRPRRRPARLHRPAGRRGRGGAAGAQRHPRVPPHEDRAGGGRRAARPHRRARPLHDDARADRPLPGRARRAGRRHGRGRARPQAGRDPRRHHRAQADLQPPGDLPGRRPAPRRALRQAHPPRGDRRVGVRRRRADPDLHALRRVGRAAGRPPHRGHRHPDRLLPRRPRRAAPATG